MLCNNKKKINSNYIIQKVTLRNPRIQKIIKGKTDFSDFYGVRLKGYKGEFTLFFRDKLGMELAYEQFKKVGIQTDILEKYSAVKYLGEGAFSTVILAKKIINNSNYAIKSIVKSHISNSINGLVY